MGKGLSSVSFSFLPSSPSFQMIGESTAAKPDLQLVEEITLLPHIHHSQQVEQEEEKKNQASGWPERKSFRGLISLRYL